MTGEDKYEYEAAFSFLKDDEAVSVQLADLLSERYRTFVYSKKQEELVGTDGQETFSAVFGERARCVVVLYRNGWGSTPWTRIEQTAIQNRALREGWDFLLFVKLDPMATTPKWLPHSYIWHDFQRYGPTGAAGAVSALIQRAGGTPHVETLEQKAARIKRETEFIDRRKNFINSQAGVAAARDGTAKLIELLKQRAESLSLTFKPSPMGPDEAAVFGDHAALMVRWRPRLSNSAQDSDLKVSYWAGHPPLWGTNYIEGPPPQLGELKYALDMAPSGEPMWRAVHSRDNRLFATEALADEVIGTLLEKSRDRMRNPDL